MLSKMYQMTLHGCGGGWRWLEFGFGHFGRQTTGRVKDTEVHSDTKGTRCSGEWRKQETAFPPKEEKEQSSIVVTSTKAKILI